MSLNIVVKYFMYNCIYTATTGLQDLIFLSTVYFTKSLLSKLSVDKLIFVSREGFDLLGIIS